MQELNYYISWAGHPNNIKKRIKQYPKLIFQFDKRIPATGHKIN